MTKKSNSIKNITTVLLALLLLGIAAGIHRACGIKAAEKSGNNIQHGTIASKTHRYTERAPYSY